MVTCKFFDSMILEEVLNSLSDSNNYNTIVVNALNIYLDEEITNKCKCISKW